MVAENWHLRSRDTNGEGLEGRAAVGKDEDYRFAIHILATLCRDHDRMFEIVNCTVCEAYNMRGSNLAETTLFMSSPAGSSFIH